MEMTQWNPDVMIWILFFNFSMQSALEISQLRLVHAYMCVGVRVEN